VTFLVTENILQGQGGRSHLLRTERIPDPFSVSNGTYEKSTGVEQSVCEVA
jgi:hypothetical protein